ncbi:SDR family NAD(P)-dependent oxidoreductase [Sphingobium algorifonticola]|uniref:SDR family NAD(P)-dependent oxidoreductase n=1 Tax=Sphingobium algorifonticola TaxID=2008318 RepID=UPI0013E3E33C|nr:3-oxoacyl-ACP reductase FabG [Sphingobium algorifonticola]
MNLGFDLAGRTALVTGAGQGLGRAIALRLASAGANVAVNDIDAAAAQNAVDEIVSKAGAGIAAPGDVSAAQDVAAMFAVATQAMGGVDILVINAGIVRGQTVDETSLDDWNHVLAVNLGGAFLCTKAMLAQSVRPGSGGRIVMIGSVVAHQGTIHGWAHYGASKSGLHGLAKSIARPAARTGMTVNVVAPGVIRTDMLADNHGEDGVAALAENVPLGRLGEPEDIAAAVHFLASDAARYITGAVLDVNGGFYIRA